MTKTTPGSAIGRIAARYTKMCRDNGVPPPAKVELIAMLKRCHEQICPLRLTALAKADNFNLSHDVTGIMRHMRRTRFADQFRPRFAVRQ